MPDGALGHLPGQLIGATGLRRGHHLRGRARLSRGAEARVDECPRQDERGAERHDQPELALAGRVHATGDYDDGTLRTRHSTPGPGKREGREGPPAGPPTPPNLSSATDAAAAARALARSETGAV